MWDESKMIEKKDRHIKQYIIWLKLLAKRLWRQPAYISLLVLIPILGYAVSAMEQGERGGAAVSVCVEEGTWSSQIADGLRQEDADSVLEFVLCDDVDTVEYSVVSGTADCGFVIPADIEGKVMGGDWRKSITVYETAESSITGMAKERISGVVFNCIPNSVIRIIWDRFRKKSLIMLGRHMRIIWWTEAHSDSGMSMMTNTVNLIPTQMTYMTPLSSL